MSKTMKYNLKDAETNVGQTVGTAEQPKVKLGFMNRLKFLIVTFLVAMGLLGYYSCTKDEVKNKKIKVISQETNFFNNPVAEFQLPKCDRLLSNSIILNGDSISYVGNLHNHLLDSLLNIPFVFNDYIDNSFISSSIFGLKFNEYYSNRDINSFVNEIYHSEIKLRINKAFDDEIIQYQTKVFLTEIANSSLNNNFNTQYFLNTLNQLDPNTIDYLICSTVLCITDYSNCYWQSNTTVSNRFLQACLAFDCLAGIGQTIKNAYDSSQNNWDYDVDEWLSSAGKAAAWGSTLGRFGL